MYSAILTGIVGVHIDKRVAIGTRPANQNPEFRRICRGVPIEARPYEYSISFPGDLILDTGNKKHLPWITQSIKREIRKRDRLYRKFLKSKDSKDRKAFLNSKHGVKRKIKTAYDKYLLDILGLEGDTGKENQVFL